MVTPKVIALDVDDVCADLMTAWLSRYNARYEDSLLPEDIKNWDPTLFLKPACHRDDFFGILKQPSLYDDVKPMPGARTAVYELLALGHRVIYVTACVQSTMDRKLDWLLQWGFLTKKNYRTDFIAAGDKSLIMANYLFDDRPENVRDFRWGRGVLVSRPHNRSFEWVNRVSSLADAPEFIARLETFGS